MQFSSRSASRLALAAMIISGCPTMSWAQDSTNGGSATADTIEEIIVTAQKRSERLQDVPIAIGAITASQAAAKGITDTASIQAAIPGLVINRTANEGNIFVRGVGTNLFGPASEQTVALYVDNVYYPSPEANLFTFNNVERIEVLKGPQGTLFGRNTTGGVVHIITREPSNALMGEVSVGYANYDTITAAAYLNTPIGDAAAIDFAGQYADQGKGYGRNIVSGEDNGVMADDNFALRSKLKLEPSLGTKLVLAGDYSHSVSRFSYQLLPGVVGVDGQSTYPGEFNSTTGMRDLERLNTGGASLQIDQQLGDLSLVSITAYRKSNVRYLLDQDDTPAIVADLSLPSEAQSWTQELQLHGAPDAPVKWMIGGFFFDGKAAYTPADVDYGFIVLADEQKTQSLAGFGQATVEILPDTNVTGGLRYTYERQKLRINEFAVGGVSIPLPDDRQTFRKLTWRAALDHRFTPDALGYVSYNRGFKSGGFNLLQPTDGPFKPEVLDAFEAGLKTEWFDRHLRFNFAAFLYEYKNIQVTIPQLGSIVTRNAARARIKGFEATLEAKPLAGLNLDANVSVLDGKYTSYPNAPYVGPNGESTDGMGELLTIDAAGNRTIATPKFTGNFGANYTIYTGIGDVRLAANAFYNDGFYFYADNRLEQPDYWLINGSLTWAPPGNQFEVQAWGKNLTDATYFAGRSEQAGLGDAQRQAAPRTYGMTLTARF